MLFCYFQHCTFYFCTFFTYACFLSVNITLMTWNSNFSVIKYVEENSAEVAARCFSVDPKRVRDWQKNKTELQRKRARLPGGGRKKASKEPEINMQEWVISELACHLWECPAWWSRLWRNKCTSDSRDEEFAVSAGWLNRFLCCNNLTCRTRTTIAQKYAREFTKKLAKLWYFQPGWLKQSGIKHLFQIAAWSQIKAWSAKWLKQINAPAIIW